MNGSNVQTTHFTLNQCATVDKSYLRQAWRIPSSKREAKQGDCDASGSRHMRKLPDPAKVGWWIVWFHSWCCTSALPQFTSQLSSATANWQKLTIFRLGWEKVTFLERNSSLRNFCIICCTMINLEHQKFWHVFEVFHQNFLSISRLLI